MPIEVTVNGEVRTIASAAAEAVIGTALSRLADGDSVDVELADEEHWLECRAAIALANGANLAALGSELIQFASAVPTGPKRFRLSGLLRGCRGTEWAMSSHAVGETFVLIAPGVLHEIALPPLALGALVSIKARGLADDAAVPVERIVTGEALRPPSPVDLHPERLPDGRLSLSWTRRSRLGWMWPDGAEVPLGESVERYRVSVGSLTFETSEPRITVPAEAFDDLAGEVTISVFQIGDYAASRPASISVTI